ncbi:DUF5685 family protein [Eubacteriales bacterium OttesenSCG-928-K08]|nr:DUF5685 family protein [Eubacteriales bacterium OttesenSCG-928-K08]
MFGYVAPLKSELKVREWTQYQAWYCGLCRILKNDHGRLARYVLDYDCTFLAVLLAATQGNAPPCELKRCGYKPFSKKKPIAPECQALSYAADCNILLYWHKLKDDWLDEKKLSAWIGYKLLKRSAKSATSRQPALAKDIESSLKRLSELEKAGEAQTDLAADAFACILRRITGGYPPLLDADRQAIEWLGYHLGRWIYFCDAWEDREKDKKSGSYNPFVLNGTSAETVSFLLYASLSEIEKAFDLLNIQSHRGLLENIVFLGCRHKTKQLLEGEG